MPSHRLCTMIAFMLRLGVLVSLVLHAFGRLDAAVRPLVIWHGLGDSHSSPGMLQFMDMIRDVHPGIFIHSVYIEEDLEKDRRASFVRAAWTTCLV
jgi:palmitoyl-protein thioesterase